MRGVIGWFAGNPVAANLLMAVFLVGGLVAAPMLPQKIFPDMDIDWLSVSVVYRGAAPTEVERAVCVKIEEELESVGGIDELSSTSSEGRCSVSVKLLSGTDANETTAEIKNRIDAITTFPEDIEQPVVSKFAMKRTVIDVAVSGDADEGTLKLYGERVRDGIAALPGVTQVELVYARPYEISIEVPEESLRRYGIGFDQIVAAVRRSSLDLPGGSVKTEGGEILLRSTGQAYSAEDFEDVVVLTRADGTRVRLGDVGVVVDGFEEDVLEARFDGVPAVMVKTYRVGDQDAIAISDAVKRFVEAENAQLPDGVSLTIWQDSTLSLRGRLDTLFRNARNGLLLVLAVLALFLRFRLAFWVSFGVPTAFLGAVMVLPALGVSINSLSLFAFIVVLGLVVDDAIVVGENVHTTEERTGDRARAAVEGTREVTVPVVFGVLTTVAAFAPLLFIPGSMGQIFSVIGIVVVACLLFSVVESQLILPAHLSQGRGRSAADAQRQASEPGHRFVDRWRRFQGAFADGLRRFVREVYEPLLERVLEWRYLSISVGVACLILTFGVVASGRMAFTFFPPAEADYVAAAVTLPRGTPVERTRAAVAHLNASAAALVEELDAARGASEPSLVRHTLASIGTQPFHGVRNSGAVMGASTGSDLGEVVLELLPSEERDLETSAVAQRWRELTGQVPDALELSFKSDLFNAGEAINIQVQGPHLAPLEEAAGRVKETLAGYTGVVDVADSSSRGKAELKLSLLPEAEPLGITMDDLARQVRQAFYGEEAQRIQRGRDDVRVMVRYPAAQRHSLGDLENMRIRTAAGAEVPFSAVARAVLGRGYSQIRRSDHMRVISVTADIDLAATTSGDVLGALRAEALPAILADYPGVSVAFEGEQREMNRAFTGLARAFAMTLLVIYALLAVPLRSYVQPLLIMSVIPFGIVGAVVGHLILGHNISFMSVIGIVAVSGVVVNASLVLVDYVNRRRAEGVSFERAVRMAGSARFRPIVLTSLTTFAGLTPLMLEQSLQAQFLIPMAISLAFGVLFSTLITLLLVPCGYLVLEDMKARWRGPAAADEPSRPRVVSSPERAA